VASNVGRQVSLCCPAYVTSSRTPAYTNEPLHRPRQRPIYIALSWSRDGHETQKPACHVSLIHPESIRSNIYYVFSTAVIYLAHHARISIGQYIVIRGIQFTVGENEHRSFMRGWWCQNLRGSSKLITQPRYIDSEEFSLGSLLLAVNKKCHDDEKLIELRKRLATYNWRRPGISAVPG